VIAAGTAEWLEARRGLITATDLPVILGLSPYKCEADLADEKNGKEQEPATLRMRAGLLLEGLIAEAYTEQTGIEVVPFAHLAIHPDIPWAAATPDFRTPGYDPVNERLVECKRTSSRSRFADGLPQDIEAQVVWQLGVTGYPVADVAVLIADDRLEVFTVDANPALFADLVAVAEDFRRRLAEGGPFAKDDARVRRDHPVDDGTMLPASPDLIALADSLREARLAVTSAKAHEETIASAIRAILGDAAGVEGVLTYRKSADSNRTNWPAVASAYRTLLADHDQSELDALVSLHSDIKTGPRVLRLSKEKE